MVRKQYTPRYVIGQIYTTDPLILDQVELVKLTGISHNDIYLAGLRYYIDGGKKLVDNIK